MCNLTDCGSGVYRLDVPIYDASVFVAKNFEKICPDLPKDCFADTFGLVWTEKGAIYIVLNEKYAYRRSSLVHECVHIADRIYTMRGVRPDAENDESFAYLVEWIYGELEKFFFNE